MYGPSHEKRGKITISCEIPKSEMVGKSVPVRGAAMKVIGQVRHVVDMKLSGVLCVKILFSPVPHARIKSIDVTQAQALEGVYAVVCYENSPKNCYNGNGEDRDINPFELVSDQTARFIRDKVAAVAANIEEIARKALSLISAEYEELPLYLDPEGAMKEDTCPIHQGNNIIMESNNSGGDVDDAIRDADHIFQHRYEMPAINHCSPETYVSIAEYDAGDKLTVRTPTQDVFGQRINLQRIFKLSTNKVRVIGLVMGGGFGGKTDLVTESVTALLAIETGRPVKMVYNRTEKFCCTCTCHAAKVDLTIAVKKDGTITAAGEAMILNAGAHTSAIISVYWVAGGKFYKPLKTRNMRCRRMPVYTNTPVASAMGGFGPLQQLFPVSSMMNEIAQSLRLDPSDVFLKNLANPFEAACNDGGSFGNFCLKDCAIRGRELIDWYKVKKQMEASRKEKSRYLIGVGMACGSHGASMFPFMPDIMGIIVKMSEDETIMFTTGTSDMGNGPTTTQCMLTPEVLGVPLDHIAYIKTDTDAAMSDLGAHVSESICASDHAAVKTARIMHDEIAVLATGLLDITTDNLNFRDDTVWCADIHREFVSMKEIVVHAGEKHQEGLSCSYMLYPEAGPMSSGVHFAKVQVDAVTNGIKVLKYAAIRDAGQTVDPTGITGQLEGGISMGLGYVLCEEMKLDNTGKNQTSSLRKYHILDVRETSKLSMDLLDFKEETGPYGAKSTGECAIVPVTPTITNTAPNAVGRQFYKPPIRPGDVLEALSLAKQERPDRF